MGEFGFFAWGGIQLALREIDRTIVNCLCEISLQVADVRATYKTLAEKGVEFTKPLRAVTGNETQELLASDFRDPDGHILSISGWEKK